jgi:uncharacterized protein with PIN domain
MTIEEDATFLADINLGRLSKWLRILGYDAVLYRGRADHAFLRKAKGENRVVLTRKGDLAKRAFPGMLIVIENDRVERQVEEVFEKLGLELSPDRCFSRCLRCNVPLKEVSRQEVQDRVSPYVCEHHARFMTCPACGGVFWPGTHSENIRNRIRALRIPFRRL